MKMRLHNAFRLFCIFVFMAGFPKVVGQPPTQQQSQPHDKFQMARPRNPANLRLGFPLEPKSAHEWRPSSSTTRVGRWKMGMMFRARRGTPVFASADGKVVAVERHRTFGNRVILDHGDGVETLYSHNSLVLVTEGSIVQKGQQIAEVGRTGYVTAACLLFQLRIHGEFADPRTFLSLDIGKAEKELP